jgi:hypothetical protein
VIARYLLCAAFMALSVAFSLSGLAGWHALWAPLAVAAVASIAPILAGDA